jgi:hypothetical protein
MDYIEQLQNEAWLNKRNDIIGKQGYRCISCLNSNIIKNLVPCYIIQPTHRYSLFVGINLKSKKRIIISIPDPILEKITTSCIVYVKEKEKMIGSIPTNGYGISLRKMTISEIDHFNNLMRLNVNEISELKTFTGRNINDEEVSEVLNFFDKLFLSLDKSYNESTFRFQHSRAVHDKSILILDFLLSKVGSELTYEYVDEISKFNWMYSYELNVHHKFYQDGKLAWEYKDFAFETYCQTCHLNLHMGN